MKKNRVLKVLFIAIALCVTGKAKAYYNGGGGFTFTGSYGGTACTSTSKMCYNNDYFFLQARLYYVDNTKGKFDWSSPYDSKGTCNGTYFFADKKSYNYLKDTLKINSDCLFNMENQKGKYNGSEVKWTSALISDGARYAKASAILRSYFGDDVNNCEGKVCTPNNNLKKFLNWVTAGVKDTSNTYASKMTKDSEIAKKTAKKVSDGATKGYRIIIEPVLMYNSPEKVLLTPKQAANKSWASSINSGSRKITGTADAQIQYLYTDFADVGIDYGSHAWCSNTSRTITELADWKIGCGMNIIDVGKYVSVHYCYDQSVAGSLTCEHNDKNNESDNFKETYTKRECTAEEDLKDTNSEYGKQIAENNNCILYCSESAFASFPGGITKGNNFGINLTPNAYFPWPSRSTTTGMIMYMKSTYDCRVMQKSGKTCGSSDISSLVSSAKSSINKLDIAAKVSGGNFNTINAESLVVDKSNTTEKNTSSLSIKDGVTGQFSVSKTTYLKMNPTTNRYFNKSTRAISNNGSAWSSTLVDDRGEGVISFSEEKTEVGKTYNLKISDIKLGTGNQFGRLITNYTCGLSFEADINCVCPNSSLLPGSALDEYFTEGKTCSQLQVEECYKKCISKKDGSKVDISDCVNNKMTSEGLTIEAAASKCEQETEICKDDTNPPSDNCPSLTPDQIDDWNACMGGKKENYEICYNRYCTRKCEYVDGKYYCKNGKICSKEQFDSDCDKKKCDDPSVTQEQWDSCMNGDDNNYAYCSEKLCEPEGPRCERVSKTTWDQCRNSGYSYATCYRKYCPYGYCKDCKYHCTTKSGEEKDISQCISDRQFKYGEEFSDAKTTCSSQVCGSDIPCEKGKCRSNCTGTCKWTKERKGNTITYVKTCDGKVCMRYPVYCPNDKCFKANNVIYRTIDLNNPFPANNGNGVTTQFSNDNIKGRLPSTNWYSTDIVNQNILSARGVKGDKLYTEKTPLYTIVISGKKIKEIRQYNKEVKSYSDFKLVCKGENKESACISDFLHSTLYDAIDRKNSVANCYNMTKDEAGFDACYNKNN